MYILKGFEFTFDKNVQNIISSGTPVNEEVKWVSGTGILTFSRALGSGEYVRALFQ